MNTVKCTCASTGTSSVGNWALLIVQTEVGGYRTSGKAFLVNTVELHKVGESYDVPQQIVDAAESLER